MGHLSFMQLNGFTLLLMKVKSQLSIFALFASLLLSACSGNLANESSSATQKLRKASDSFQADRLQLSTRITSTIDDVNGELAKSTPDLKEATSRWEKGWNGVQSIMKDLRKDQKQMADASEEYFKKLDEIAQGISVDSTKREELQKNADARMVWQNMSTRLDQKLATLDGMIKDGDNQLRKQLADNMRSGAKPNLTQLQITAAQAKVQIEQMGQLIEQGGSAVGLSITHR